MEDGYLSLKKLVQLSVYGTYGPLKPGSITCLHCLRAAPVSTHSNRSETRRKIELTWLQSLLSNSFHKTGSGKYKHYKHLHKLGVVIAQ